MSQLISLKELRNSKLSSNIQGNDRATNQPIDLREKEHFRIQDMLENNFGEIELDNTLHLKSDKNKWYVYINMTFGDINCSGMIKNVYLQGFKRTRYPTGEITCTEDQHIFGKITYLEGFPLWFKQAHF